MIIDPLRSALFLSPAEDDDADEAVLLWAPLVPEPAADIDDAVPPVLNDGVRVLGSVDVTSAGAGVADVGAIGTDADEDGAGAASLADGAGAASLDDVAGSGAPPPLASATLAYFATLSLGPGLTIITIPCVQWGDEKT